jgi:superoxide reductase
MKNMNVRKDIGGIMKFYRCNHCKNVFIVADEDRAEPVCCGENMKLLVANATDGEHNKHVPVIEHHGDQVTVRVGTVPHPMSPEHHIEWICLVSSNGGSMVTELSSSEEPVAVFTIKNATLDELAAYEYCNLHGLWRSNAEA